MGAAVYSKILFTAEQNVPFSSPLTPPSTLPTSSITFPKAFTANIAPTFTPFGSSKNAVPKPDFIALSIPNTLPIVAPVPAPTLPLITGALLAFLHAAAPYSGVGRTFPFATSRSNNTADVTIGTINSWATGIPIFCYSK